MNYSLQLGGWGSKDNPGQMKLFNSSKKLITVAGNVNLKGKKNVETKITFQNDDIRAVPMSQF